MGKFWPDFAREKHQLVVPLTGLSHTCGVARSDPLGWTLHLPARWVSVTLGMTLHPQPSCNGRGLDTIILRASSRLAMAVTGHFLLLNAGIGHLFSLSSPQSGNQGRLFFTPPPPECPHDKYWASESISFVFFLNAFTMRYEGEILQVHMEKTGMITGKSEDNLTRKF